MRDILADGRRERLAQKEYLADFEAKFWRIGPEGFWKLERLQSYQEPGFASWEALREGDWSRSLDIIAGLRDGIQQHLKRVAAAGIGHRRVRVIEEPVSTYIQWEMHLLLVRQECGENIKCVPARSVSELETERQLPELVVLGDQAAYDIHYTPDGAPDGATRYSERATVSRLREAVKKLHDQGEGFEDYFGRCIAPLPPPRVL
jgi:hypothetical protein